jgi:hypothetical protein
MTLDTRARRAAQGIHRAVEVMEMSTFTKGPRKVERFDRFRDRKQRNRRIGAIVVGTAIVITTVVVVSTNALDRGQGTVPADRGDGSSHPASLVEPVQIGTVTSSGDGCALEIEAETIRAGAGRLTVVNETDQPVTFDLFRLGSQSFARLEEAVANGWVYNVIEPGGGGFATEHRLLREQEVRPGASSTLTDNFTTGDDFAVVCAHRHGTGGLFGPGRRAFALVGPIVVP